MPRFGKSYTATLSGSRTPEAQLSSEPDREPNTVQAMMSTMRWRKRSSVSTEVVESARICKQAQVSSVQRVCTGCTHVGELEREVVQVRLPECHVGGRVVRRVALFAERVLGVLERRHRVVVVVPTARASAYTGATHQEGERAHVRRLL
jgi:hypothetical protein